MTWAMLLYWLAIIPAAWLFSHATQLVWIQQECGTPELIIQRARICADNALRLQWGGVIGAAIFLLIFSLLQWPFRSMATSSYRKVIARMTVSFQVFWLAGFALLPTLRSDKILACIALLFLTVFIALLHKEIVALFQNTDHDVGIRSQDRFVDVLFYSALAYQIIFAIVSFTNPILDHFSWRQTQTAISTHYLITEGFRLDYITPLFGKPWSIPMEFPLYQYMAAALVRLTGLSVESASRIVSLASFYGCVLVLRAFLRDLRFSRIVVRLVLAIILLCPLYVFYARAVLIETLATFLGLVSLWAAVRFFQSYLHRWLLVLFVASALCALTKITTFVVFAFFMAGIFLFFVERPPTANFSPRNLYRYTVASLAAVILPLIVGIIWVRYADAIKSLNPIIGDMWTSAALKTWNFGTLEQRFTIDFWRQILVSRLRDILGHLAPLIFIIFLLVLARLRTQIKYWVVVGVIAFFAGPLIFATLYYVHDYYFVANGIFLLMALGLTLGVAYEKAQGNALRNYRVLVILPLVLSLVSWYADKYLPRQLEKKYTEPTIGAAVQALTQSSDVIILHGDFAHPNLPYYARRKTLINEGNFDSFGDSKMQRALANLQDENIGAVLLPQNWATTKKMAMIDNYVRRYGFKKTPTKIVEGAEIYTK
ncbi:MAG: hypothetical protein JSR44_04605 [Spirochaetes bacterium]|nr:hypothetical protein [Spirochaetota bacterium]